MLHKVRALAAMKISYDSFTRLTGFIYCDVTFLGMSEIYFVLPTESTLGKGRKIFVTIFVVAQMSREY